MIENFVKNNKIWLTIFGLSILVLIIVSLFTYKSLYFDAPALFFQLLYQEVDKCHFFMYIPPRTRLFSDVLFALPYNCLVHFLPDVPMVKCNLFYFSYLIINLGALLLNFYIAKRTKQYNIAIFALAYYALFYLPNFVWYVKESHLAILMSFALLQYFFTNEKLKKADIFLVVFLAIYAFSSYETQAFTGVILFAASILLYKKDVPNKNLKLYLGIAGMFSCIYILSTLLYCFTMDIANISVDGAFEEYISSFTVSMGNIFNTCSFISFVALITICAAFFINKPINKNGYVWLGASILAMAFFLYFTIHFYVCPTLEVLNFIFGLIIFYIILFALFFERYFDRTIFNDNFLNNLLIISCIFGVLHACWQINSSRFSYDYAMNLKNKLQSNELKITFTDEDRNEDWFLYDKSFGTFLRSLLLTEGKTVNNIIVPSKNTYDDGFLEETYFDRENNCVVLQTVKFPVISKYYDMSKIIPVIEDCQKLNEQQKK